MEPRLLSVSTITLKAWMKVRRKSTLLSTSNTTSQSSLPSWSPSRTLMLMSSSFRTTSMRSSSSRPVITKERDLSASSLTTKRSRKTWVFPTRSIQLLVAASLRLISLPSASGSRRSSRNTSVKLPSLSVLQTLPPSSQATCQARSA